jgi:putative sterol carrier protein
MVNEKLKEKMLQKIEDGEFESKDLMEYINLFCQISTKSEDIQEEVDDWSCVYQIEIQGMDDFWIKISEGQFEYATGRVDNPDNTLKANADIAAQIFIGDKDATAAYMSGALKIEGKLPNAVKLRTIIEIVREELEY